MMDVIALDHAQELQTLSTSQSDQFLEMIIIFIEYTKILYRYNTLSDTWTLLSETLPTPLELHTAMFIEDPC